jgi:hypothetical protein
MKEKEVEEESSPARPPSFLFVGAVLPRTASNNTEITKKKNAAQQRVACFYHLPLTNLFVHQ